MDMKLPASFETAPSAAQRFVGQWRRLSERTRVVLGVTGAAILGIVGAVILGVSAAAIVVALLWHFTTPADQEPAAPPPPVTIAHARVRDVTAMEHTIGTVVSVATVQVTAQVSGQLLNATFREGQIVHAGDLLFQIDPRPFAAALQQAQATLARDQANALSAAHDKARFTALAAQGAASSQQRDQAIAAADADAAVVKADRAAIAMAQLNLGFTTIRSPITGKTGPILVQPGNLVTANNTASPLVVITQVQPIKVSVSLPQAELPQLIQQMRTGRLNAIVNLHNGAPLEQAIDFIGNQVDARTGTIELRATFANTDYRLVPGQLVDTAITTSQYSNAIVVPRDAVNLGPANRYVYVVGKDNIARMHDVSVLYDDGSNAAITGDVKSGDTVIVEGQLRVQPGSAVQIARRIPT